MSAPKVMTGTRPTSARIASFRRGVLSWYATHRRDLPWRRTTDPWHILVSELMLQQTQVDRVRERYAAFFRRWSTVSAFASASLAEVLGFWTGLGYNRRAKHLRSAANVVVTVHGGKVPMVSADLLSLPGVGPYTAAAVLAFAGNIDTVVCDTNVRRVVLRYFFGGEHAAALPPPRELDAVMGRLLPRGRSREWHSALMDIGALVCTGRLPDCAHCPLRRGCRSASARAEGRSVLRRLVRPQSAFEGSRRQVRGTVVRLLAAAGRKGLSAERLSAALPDADVPTVVDDLIAEGLVETSNGAFRLPE